MEPRSVIRMHHAKRACIALINWPRGLRIRIRATCHLLFPCLLFQFEFPTLLAKREIIANAVYYVICLVTLSVCFLFAVLRWLLSRLNVSFPRSMGFNFCKVSIWLRDGKENDEGVLAKEVLGRWKTVSFGEIMFFHGPLEHISSGMGWSFNWSNANPKQVTTGSVWGFTIQSYWFCLLGENGSWENWEWRGIEPPRKSILDDGMTSSFSAFVDKVGAGMENTDFARPTIFASG